MSEQSDQLNATLRERGVIPPPPPGTAAGNDDEGGRPNLPVLELPRDGWGLDDFAREAGKVTKLNGVFRRENVPVTIDHEMGTVEPMDPDRFRTYLANLALLFKWKAGGKDQPPERSKQTMAKDTAVGTLKSDQFVNQQRRLTRVNPVRMPVLRKDGRLELLPEGYDPDSGVFTSKSEVVIREDMAVEEARAMLTDLHREFDFPDWLEVPKEERKESLFLSRQVALMVSFYGALMLHHTSFRQGGFFNANRERSGKGLLARIIIVPVMGRAKFRAKPDKPEELQKMLDSAALCASPYLMLDDLAPGNLKSQVLNSFITTGWWAGRTFHTQREFECPLQTMVFMTGHNVTLTGDLVGRCLEVKLHMEEADVTKHHIDRVINEGWLARPAMRSDICSALWTMIRHWDKSGRPAGPSRKPGFEDWSEMFGGIVAAAGFGDPCTKIESEESADPEYEDMRALVSHLMSDVKDRQLDVEFENMVAAAQHLNCFEWIIEGKWHSDKESKTRWFEPTDRCNSRLGLLWTNKYGGAIFRLEDGRKVRFGKRGKNRHKRYTLTVE